jgi:hypothetical protein
MQTYPNEPIKQQGAVYGAQQEASHAAAQGASKSMKHGHDATQAKKDEKLAEASKEAHWAAAKDSDLSKRERAADAIHAAGDFVEEKKEGLKYHHHKEQAKH